MFRMRILKEKKKRLKHDDINRATEQWNEPVDGSGGCSEEARRNRALPYIPKLDILETNSSTAAFD
jgi:hypothetical protein